MFNDIKTLNLLPNSDSFLREVCQTLPEQYFGSSQLRSVALKMFDLMRTEGGVGLAAPQVGIDARLFVYSVDDPQRNNGVFIPDTVVVNPEITFFSEELEEDTEGCLSVDRVRGLVPRHSYIEYTAYNLDGELFNKVAHGFEARIIQHEYDHLEGVLFTDRITEKGKLLYLDKD